MKTYRNIVEQFAPFLLQATGSWAAGQGPPPDSVMSLLSEIVEGVKAVNRDKMDKVMSSLSRPVMMALQRLKLL